MDARVLCLYVSLPEEITHQTLKSIKSQTHPVSKLVMVTERSGKPTLYERVSEVVNNALAKENLNRYDYIWRVDADAVPPQDFLESNLALKPDILGFGSSQLIKVSTFQKVMGGRLHPEQDDVYIRHRFQAAGYPATAPAVKALRNRKTAATQSTVGYNMLRGEIKYRCGILPLHLLFNNLKPSKEHFWIFIGYLRALLKRVETFDTAVFMRRQHLKTMLDPKKMFSRVKRKAKVGAKPAWLRGPQVLQLDTHNFCNENCVYCNVEHLCGGKHGVMPLSMARRAIRELRGVKHVRLYLNGEALLETRLHVLAQIVKDESPDTNIIVYVNGAAYENRELLRDRNIDEVHFTVSANTPETYALVHGKPYFHKVLKTISWLAKNKYAKQKIVVRYVTIPQNVGEIAGWKNRFRDFETVVTPLHCGLEQHASDKLTAEGGVHKLHVRTTLYLDNFPCGCWNNMSISFDGRILQCCDVPYSINYGRVGEVPLLKAWRNRLENKMMNPACQACNLKHPKWREILDKYIETSSYMELIA